MIATVVIVAGVCGLALSYLGLIHHFWLGESSNENSRPGAQTAEKEI